MGVKHSPQAVHEWPSAGSSVPNPTTACRDRLAIFLRDTGAIDDSFTIIKGALADPLRLATFRMQNGITIATWNSEVGKTYRVETSDTVEGHGWQPASGNILASGATTSWTNSIPSGATKKFYR